MKITKKEFIEALGEKRGNEALLVLDKGDGKTDGEFDPEEYAKQVGPRMQHGTSFFEIGGEIEFLNAARAAANKKGLASAENFKQAEKIVGEAAKEALQSNSQAQEQAEGEFLAELLGSKAKKPITDAKLEAMFGKGNGVEDTFFKVKVPKDRRELATTLRHWHDSQRVSDEEVKRTKNQLDRLPQYFVAKEVLFYRAGELLLNPYNGGPGVIDPEGWVRGVAPIPILKNGQLIRSEVVLKFNLFQPELTIENDGPMQQREKLTVAEKIATLQEIAQQDPDYKNSVSSPNAVFTAFQKAANSGVALKLAGLTVPDSLRAFAKRISQEASGYENTITYEDDLTAATVINEVLVAIFANQVLPSDYKETKIDDVVRREYPIVVDGEKGEIVFEKHGAIWLINLAE